MTYLAPQPVDWEHIDALGVRVPRGEWLLKIWPTCGEATVTFRKAESLYVDSGGDIADRGNYRWQEKSWSDVEDNATRAVRRARGEVRRYNRHNALLQMITFTFAGDVPQFDSLAVVVQKFWQRWEYRTGEKRGAYLWVPEWGTVTGRLHIHMAVSWWDRLKCVEVCPKCDKYKVLERFPRAVPAGALCVGCLWGQGFVGRPMTQEGAVESNEDGRGLSKYLSKYMAKELGGGVRAGGQRYRVAQGFAPESVTWLSGDLVAGIVGAIGEMSATVAFNGLAPEMFVPSDSAEWSGPPVVVLDWKSQSLTKGV